MSEQEPSVSVGEPFHEVVLKLQRFWADQGCVVLSPCDFQVPYATLQPEAFFRILGSEPWRAAYAQPLRRPLDGRYGKHPFRFLEHVQLEVVLKPPPRDMHWLYLESLRVLGLDLTQHDVRFTEWRWEPISLGARGSGWHVLVDGLGIARMTLLERIADQDLDPLVLEVSYGLERLAMLASGVETAFATDDEARRHDEAELSRYVAEVADIGLQQRRFEALDHEASRCLEAGLARPAFELAVRCLEPLDILEARGATTARERRDGLELIRGRVAAAAALHLTSEKKRRAAKKSARRKPAARKSATRRPKTRKPARRKPAKAAADAKAVASETKAKPAAKSSKKPTRRRRRKPAAKKDAE